MLRNIIFLLYCKERKEKKVHLLTGKDRILLLLTCCSSRLNSFLMPLLHAEAFLLPDCFVKRCQVLRWTTDFLLIEISGDKTAPSNLPKNTSQGESNRRRGDPRGSRGEIWTNERVPRRGLGSLLCFSSHTPPDAPQPPSAGPG